MERGQAEKAAQYKIQVMTIYALDLIHFKVFGIHHKHICINLLFSKCFPLFIFCTKVIELQ